MTIFTRMTALAERDGRGQPRPGLPRRGRAGGDHRGRGRRAARRPQPVRAAARRAGAARGDRRAPAAALRHRARPGTRSRSPSARPRRSPPRCSRWSSPATRCSCSTPATTATRAIVGARRRRAAADRARAARLARSRGASRAIAPRTRVLLLNSPHNPTGRVLDRAELELLADACREHDLIAITDEVYEHLVFDGEHIPLATLPDGRAHADGVVARQDALGHRLEDRLGERARPSWSRGSATSSSSSPSPAARRSSTRPRWRSALPTPIRCGDGAARQARPPRGGPRARRASTCSHTEGTYFLNADGTPGEPTRPTLCDAPAARGGRRRDPAVAVRRATGWATLLRFAFSKRDDVLDEAIERLTRSRGASGTRGG